MTTIGTAVLQIIPSLRGVTEAIESQIDGKAVDIQIKPKVDQRATEAAAKETRETVEKQTTEVKVQPKVDTRAAEQAGKSAGEAVTKGATDAVEQSSTGKDIAKVLVDGIADGVKGELRGGPLVDEFVDGLADGVKQGIDAAGPGVGKSIIKSVTDGIKSGNLSGAIKGAVTDVGTSLRSSAVEWSSGIANSLRSGDIQGATDEIGNRVRTTTDIIANIGSAFGLQLDGVRQFGEGSATTLQTVGGNVQEIIGKTSEVKSTFADTGELLGTVLPGRAGAGAQKIIGSLGSIIGPATAVYDALNRITQNWHADQQERWWKEWEADQRAREMGLKPAQPGVGDVGGPPAVGQGNAPSRPAPPALETDIRARIAAGKLPGFSIAPNGDIVDKDGNPVVIPKGRIPGSFDYGGYTGNLPVDQIAGVVHGGEYVIRKSATDRIRAAAPGLLDALNGYAGGGLVAGTSELRKIIGQRFGISNIGGYRPADGFNEHSTGRALDVMVGNNKSQGDAVKDFALANASAIDLKWVIWRQHLYYPGGGGYDMPDRGNPTQNHMDHVHIFSGPGIANGLRGALKGQQTQQQRPTAAAGPGAIDPASTDTTGASVAGVAPSTSEGSGSGGFSVPSSLSGLSTLGLDKLGVTTSTQIGSGSQERTFDIGSAVSSAVGGQVSSALGVFGVNDSPGWLQGISKFVGGISVSDKNGKKVFDGGNIGGTFGDAGSLFGGAAPAAPPAPAALPGGAVHGGQAGAAPGPVFNTTISAFDTTDAVTMWDRKKNEIVASKIGHI
ncbi:hypothetical protein A5637_13145 [Mycolicibacterium fortuitum]|uniref:hypothetical protein n=1 Tax=Mycolicibacterium fortuitum TaxID=1766 RepID=UPI0007ED0EE9|nr:hypothetical protein [Mycolicibacterium fortuitum]OBK04023.1 hypothetical protein A5637_13145 [Mycolicibacterium fortuitum]